MDRKDIRMNAPHLPRMEAPDDVAVQRAPAGLGRAAEAALLRADIVRALHAAGGHYGGSLSVIDVLLALYRGHVRVNPRAPRHPDRDRLLLSKGHAAVALYAVLRRLGFFEDDLCTYADYASNLEGHPDMKTVPGVDFSTGSLGQGLSVGCGMAIALRETGRRVFVVLGDGECQEGQVWEAAMFASANSISNLTAVVDCNGLQEWGRKNRDGASLPPLTQAAQKWRAFGWNVVECDGHDFAAIDDALTTGRADPHAPTAVICHTRKGKGALVAESRAVDFHCAAMTDEEHVATLRQILESHETC
jgi:transketolase